MCATSIRTRRPRFKSWPRASSPATCWRLPASSSWASHHCGCWQPRPMSWVGRRPTCERWSASDLPPAEELATLFREMQATAQQEGRSLTDVSAALGLAAAKAGVEMGNVHIFDFYRDALGAIREEGLLRFLRRVAKPYVSRAGGHFDPNATTYTDRFLRWIDSRRGDAQSRNLP